MRNLFFLLLIGFIAFSCNDKKKALDLNNKIAGYSQELERQGKEIGTLLNTAIQTRNFSKVSERINDLQKYVNDKSDELQKMDNVNGSESLVNSMKDFMRYEKELIGQTFVPFTTFNANTSDAEIQTAVQNLITKSKEEEAYLNKVRKEQQAYADKNGFKIESKPNL